MFSKGELVEEEGGEDAGDEESAGEQEEKAPVAPELERCGLAAVLLDFLLVKVLDVLEERGHGGEEEQGDEDAEDGPAESPSYRMDEEHDAHGQDAFAKGVAESGDAESFSASFVEHACHGGGSGEAEEALSGEAESEDSEEEDGDVGCAGHGEAGADQAGADGEAECAEGGAVDEAAEVGEGRGAEERGGGVECAELGGIQLERVEELRDEDRDEERLAEAGEQSKEDAEGEDARVGKKKAIISHSGCAWLRGWQGAVSELQGEFQDSSVWAFPRRGGG